MKKNRAASFAAWLLSFISVFILPAFVNAASQNHEDERFNMSYAPENFFRPPTKALISPHQAYLENREEVEVKELDGSRFVSFIIPANASNLQLRVPGSVIARWISEPVTLKTNSAHSTARARLERERVNLQAQLTTLQARIDIWKTQAPASGSQDLAQRQSLMEQSMPGLVQSAENLKSRLGVIKRELDLMPAADEVGEKITVFLAGEKASEDRVPLEYSYNIPSCGWNAVYEFNARPDGDKSGKGDIVEVRLMAEVWQYTGMDWGNTEITLATKGGGPREPYPLPRWVIGEKPKPQPRAAVMSAKAAKDKTEEAAGIANLQMEPPPTAPVDANVDSIYASWQLSARGLPEGRSRLEIMSDAWQAPLQWLARPVSGDNRVWLYAKYTLPPLQGWPDGTAQYSVDNQSVGDGYFRPMGGEATLYFGADPRVQIKTTIDSSKQGETGIINTNKTWSWAWTYTLTNMHNLPVKVKVERPEPIVLQEGVQVSYNDKPVAIKDEKEHMIYWNADVPANGKFEITHQVTVTAPVKLELLPDIP